jgi:diguanylate cyclase (GGDEF)-like protein
MPEHDYEEIKYVSGETEEVVIDQLTGIFNRNQIISIANGLIEDKTPFTLMILDLDNFKQINDSFGHLSGDFILKSIGEKLKEYCFGNIYVGRYGGDEFLLLLPNVVDYDDVHKTCEKLFERNKIFRRYYNDGIRDIYVTATVGCAKYPEDDSNYEELFTKADKALYRGKTKGRNCYIIYVESKHKNIVIHEKAEGSLLRNFNSVKRMFDIYRGKEQILKSTVDFLYSELHCSYVYYLSPESTVLCNYSDNIKYTGERYDIHLELLLNGDSLFFETPLTKFKAQDPILRDFIEEHGIQSMLVSKLETHGRNFGYIVIFEREITRIWQETEIALVMYVSALLELELCKQKK